MYSLEQLIPTNKYIIDFIDDDDNCYDNISEKYNGIYRLIKIKFLEEADYYERDYYGIFKSLSTKQEIHIFNRETFDCVNYGLIYFHAIIAYADTLITVKDGDNAATYECYYDHAFCKITPDYTDEYRLYVSLILRKNLNRHIPVEIERTIQEFI